MEATQILMNEHRVIERVLNALLLGTDRVLGGEEMRPAFFINASLFIKNFADGCHHKKEEGILFIALNELGISPHSGPLVVMLAEHEQGRSFNREMNASAQAWDKGDTSAKSSVLENARGYVALLRQHIHKEDNILFPLANRIIPAERKIKIMQDFVTIETEETGAGMHEKYLALAEVLEKESVRK